MRGNRCQLFGEVADGRGQGRTGGVVELAGLFDRRQALGRMRIEKRRQAFPNLADDLDRQGIERAIGQRRQQRHLVGEPQRASVVG